MIIEAFLYNSTQIDQDQDQDQMTILSKATNQQRTAEHSSLT